jgi:hypothetical protein
VLPVQDLGHDVPGSWDGLQHDDRPLSRLRAGYFFGNARRLMIAPSAERTTYT